MRHFIAFPVLLGLLAWNLTRHVAPDPYTYDEADYMYAASLGFFANYTDIPTLPITGFIRTGLASGRDPHQRQALSERIRGANDVVFYRHWHGPLYLYCLVPISRLGWNERSVRTAMLVIPVLSLAAMYFGILWLIPGSRGTWMALMSAVLLLSSNSVIHSTELAPHPLFALFSICCLVLLAKTLATGQRCYWYASVILAGLAFCTLEIAFIVLLTLVVCGYMERVRLEAGWSFVARSLALFVATVLVVWPAAIFKLSFIKAYLFMAYLALFRKAAWGGEGFLEVWRARILDSPLEWTAIVAALVIYLRMRSKLDQRLASPALLYALLMVIATIRVVSSVARYSLLFTPALDLFAAVVLISAVMSWPRRAAYGALFALAGSLAIAEYRILAKHDAQDPRPPAVLTYIRTNGLARKTLLVPQDDLPMIHYYFPEAHLHGYSSELSDSSSESGFAPDAILYSGFPLHVQRAH